MSDKQEAKEVVESARKAREAARRTVDLQVKEALEALPTRTNTYADEELADELNRIADLLKARVWLSYGSDL